MAANAILAINSTDRYIDYTVTTIVGFDEQGNPIFQTNNNQPRSNTLESEYTASGPYSNDFSISSPNALINGYIYKIIVSQIQLQYNLPTIIPGRNDTLNIKVENSPGANTFDLYKITLPYGFYSPDDLAAMLSIALNTQPPFDVPPYSGTAWNVYYRQQFGSTGYGFEIVNNAIERFYIPTPVELRLVYGYKEYEIENHLKFCKLIGFNVFNAANTYFIQTSSTIPNFLYTPFIDIYSDNLTNYQDLKDTDTSVIKRKGLVARVYLSGVGQPQNTSTTNTVMPNTNNVSEALGSRPFVLTVDLNNAKIIQWTPDTAINTLDFQVRDCYGDLLFVYDTAVPYGQSREVFNTEFQMTLLCVEHKKKPQ